MILEMLDFRLIIETEFAKLAAREYTASDIKAIELSLVHMKQEISDGGIGLNGDNEFHEAVVQATHNNVFMKMLLMSKSLLSKTREATLRIENQPESSLADHREIYEAIRDRNAETAADLMNQHLRKTRENAVSKQSLAHVDSGE